MGINDARREAASEDLKFLCLLLALVLGLMVPNLFLWRPALGSPATSDLASQWHPYAAFFRSAYLSGHFPLWNPHDLCGAPFLAFSNSGCLYPAGFLYLLRFPLATTLSIMLHLALAAGLSYWLFRSAGRSPAVAFILALSWSLGGEFFRQLSFIPTLQTLAWVPLFFLAALKLAGGLRLKWLLVMVLAFSAAFLGGDSEALIYLVLFLLWWAWVISAGDRNRRLLLICLGLAVCLLLASAQWIPLMELFQKSIRGASSYMPEWESPPLMVLAGILFVALGLIFPAIIPGASHADATDRYPVYVGFLIVLGFILALRDRRNRPPIPLSYFYLIMLIFWAIIFTPFLRPFSTLIPLFGRLLNGGKVVPALEFCFLMIAGFGLDHFLERKSPRLEKWAVYFFPGYGILTGAASFLIKPAMIARMALAAVLVSFPLWKNRLKPKSWLVLLAILDIYGLAWFYFPRVSYDEYKLDPALTAKLGGTALQGRYAIFSPLVVDDVGLPYSAGMILEADGLDSLTRSPLWNNLQIVSLVFPKILRWKADKVIFYDQFALRDFLQLTEERLDFLDLLNLRWAFSRYPVPLLEKSGRYRAAGSAPLYVYENKTPLARAAVYHRIRTADADAAYNLIRTQAFDFRRELAVSPAEAPQVAAGEDVPGQDSVLISRPSPDRFLVSFQTQSPGYLFLDENYFPGWQAELDGRPARIWRADYAFRAVYAEPGRHQLRFYYRPLSFRVGLWCSLATLLALSALGIFLTFRTRSDRPAASWPAK